MTSFSNFDPILLLLADQDKINIHHDIEQDTDISSFPCWCSHPRNASFWINYKENLLQLLLDSYSYHNLFLDLRLLIIEYLICHSKATKEWVWDPRCLSDAIQLFDETETNVTDFDWSKIKPTARLFISVFNNVNNVMNHSKYLERQEFVVKYLLYRKKPSICVVQSRHHNLEDVTPHCFHHNNPDNTCVALAFDTRYRLISHTGLLSQKKPPHFAGYEGVVIQGNMADLDDEMMLSRCSHSRFGIWVLGKGDDTMLKIQNKKRLFDWWIVTCTENTNLVSRQDLYTKLMTQNILPSNSSLTLDLWMQNFVPDRLILIHFLTGAIYHVDLPKKIPPFRLDTGGLFELAICRQLKRVNYSLSN